MKTLSPKTIFYLPISLFVKYKYHAKIDDQIDKALASMTQGLINKLVSVLEATLGKLSRYDEGSFIGSFLKITVSFI
jgi:calcium-dependent secretion activator